MDGAPRSRVTVALAVAAIVAAVALLVGGAVLAPPGETESPVETPAVEEDEAAAAPLAAPTTTTTMAHAEHAEHAEHADADADADVVVETFEAGHEAHEPVPGGEVHDVHVVGEVVESHDVHVATPGTTVVAHVDHVEHAVPTTTVPAVTPIVALDDPRLSPSQRAAAQDLLDRTTAALAALPDLDAVVAAGYAPVGEPVAGYQDLVADPYLDDGVELDADHIESVLVHDGVVVAATYLLSAGSTLADAPDLAGELTPWRDHDGRCWEGERAVALVRADGSCARGQVRTGVPRLRVWLAPTPCGPFGAFDCAV